MSGPDSVPLSSGGKRAAQSASRLPGELLRPVDLHRTVGGSLGSRGATSFVGLAFQGLLRLAVNVVIGRLAGAAVLGVVAAGQATAQFLILLWPTTAGQAASRFLARARGRADAAEIDAVARHLGRTVVVAALLLAALSVPVSLARGVSPGGAACIAALLIGLAGQQYTRGVHYGVGAVTRVVVLDIAFSLLGLAGVVAALLAGVRDLRLLLPLAAAFVLLTIACWPWKWGTPRRQRGPGPGSADSGLAHQADRGLAGEGDRGLAREADRGRAREADRELAREIDAFVFFGSLGTIASAGLVQLSVIVASWLGDAEAGTYSAAYNLAIPLTLLSGALSLVLYPTMSEAFGRGDEAAVRSQLDRGVRGLLLLVVPIVAVVALFAPEVVRLLYGPGFATSASVLVLLLFAVLVSMIAVPCVNATTSGHARGIVEISVASIVGLVVAVVMWWALLGAGAGVLGVALGYLGGVTTTGGYAFVRSWIAWRLRWGTSVLLPLVGAVAVVSGAVVWAGDTAWWTRLAIALALVGVWLIVLPTERRAWTARLSRPN